MGPEASFRAALSPNGSACHPGASPRREVRFPCIHVFHALPARRIGRSARPLPIGSGRRWSMTFLAPNYIAILVAAAVAYVLGALWYRIFAQPWLDAIGKTRDGVKPSAGPYIVAAVADLVIAWVLSGIMGHLGQINVRTGLIS